jgi:hypothetical protein
LFYLREKIADERQKHFPIILAACERMGIARGCQYVVEVRRRTPATTINCFSMWIVDDAVTADTATPRCGLPSESLNVTAEGVLLHCEQRLLNASLIFCGQFSQLFLGGAGDLEVPGHCVSRQLLARPRGTAPMIPNSRVEKPLGHGEGRRVRLAWVLRRDSAIQNRRAAPRAPIPIGCETLFCGPPRTASAWREGGRCS